MAKLKVEYFATAKLVPYANNARTHSDTQIEQIANSIREFGFTNPILVDQAWNVVAGHGRLEAAKLLELDEVPCIRLGHLSDRQRKAYVLADNRIALGSGWDFEKLANELNSLVESDFDLSLTGFAEDELDALLKADASILPDGFGEPEKVTVAEHQRTVPTEVVKNGLREDDATPEVTEKKVVAKRGDVWILGDHRVVCGDSLNIADVDLLMAGKIADMIFTDPPYNVKISGLGSGSFENKNSIGKIHGEFAMASGEMSDDEFTSFLKKVFDNMVARSKDGAIHYVCMDWRHMHNVLGASDAYLHNGGGVLVGSQTANHME